MIRALKAGDETAFVALIHAHHSVLLRVAMTYVSSRAAAEEVVQETWLGVLKGLDRFEARSSLKSWIFRIAANIARTRAIREPRCLRFSSPPGTDAERIERSVDPDRFFSPDHARFPGHWARTRLLGNARGATAVGRDPRRHLCSDRAATARTAARRHDARCRGVVRGRDLPSPRHDGRQRARLAPPGAIQGARRARAPLQRRRDDRVRTIRQWSATT
jgi:RNA polymerase sigma factor (sigma-70 family)